MKKDSFVFFVFVFCVLLLSARVSAFDQYTCDLCKSLLGECDAGSCVYANRVLLTGAPGATGSVCSDAQLAAKNTEMAKSQYSGGSCTSAGCCASDDCAAFVLSISCGASWVAEHKPYEDAKFTSGTVSEVPIGQERQAAEVYFNSFDGSNNYEDYTAQGLIRTDGLKGYMYSAALSQNETQATVIVDVWKRGGYAPEGVTTTLEGLGGGTGGGQGLSWEGYPGLKPDDLSGLSGNFNGNTGQSSTPYEYSGAYAGDVHDLSDTFNDFVGDMKNSSLYGVITSYFDAGAGLSGGAGVIDLSTDTFGSHSFNFASFLPYLGYLKYVILIAFGYKAVRVAAISGAG